MSCEELVCGWVRQPSNTYSNIGYFLAAFLLWRRSRTNAARAQHDVPFAVMAALIGVSSVLAHASIIRVFGILDFTSIFVLFSYIATGNLAEMGGWSSWRRHALAIGLSIASIAPQLYGNRTGIPTFALYMVMVLWTEWVALRTLKPTGLRRHYLLWSFGFLAAGLICFGLDEEHIVCDPTNHIWPLHSVWHLLTAASLYYGALYFESKRGRPADA